MRPGENGWHRKMRVNANREPRSKPCVCNASMAYSLQVGWNLQEPARNGRIIN